jgi:hypothetical protein
MILPSLNGMQGFGFAEAIELPDGTLRRAGRLEISLTDATRLQLLIQPSGPMTYSGPVWIDGVWQSASFAVVARPIAFLTDRLAIVAVAECESPTPH